MDKIDLVAMAQEIVATFRKARNRKIDLRFTSDNLIVIGNKNQLEQIFYILIDNALKYSKDEIEVSLTQKDEFAILQVIDHGQGIEDIDMKRVFNRFYRVDKARNRDTGGTGLGLAIAKSIVESHQGEIFARSNLNEGTKFTVKLKRSL